MKAWLIDSGLGAGFCFRLLAPLLLSTVVACGADGRGLVDDCLHGGCCPPGGCVSGDAGIPTPDTTAASDAAAPTVESGDAPVASAQRSPLCAQSGCFPGFAQACGANAIPLVDDAGDDGEGDEDAASAPVDAGLILLDGSSTAVEASASADAALIIIDVSVGRMPPPAEAGVDDSQSVPQACYVIPTGSGVQAACAPAGHGAAGTACRDSSDCASTLACVEFDGRGVCQPFSCALPPNCLPGTFYQQAPLMAGGVPLPQTVVPVCSPNVPCPLLQLPTTCIGGKVCAVVGQGETSCMTPGPSKQNEWCDESTGCGEGLVCALRPDKTQNKCLKLCHIEKGAAECPGGTCQGGNNAIPDGFGICVGDTADGG